MGDVINLLIVEDSADDASLLLAELKRKGQSPSHHRVETKDQFLAALQKNTWDAVISDYVLPNFSGPEALYLLRQHSQETPFIMVSGIYGEEEAVRMMKAGANDYVMKGNMSRLAPALERELGAAQDRRRRKRAEGAMQFLAAIVESSADAIYGKNLDSLIVSWNPAAERLFGYHAEEIVGHSNAVLYPHQRREEMLEILSTIRRGEVVVEQETERLHKNGRIIPVSITVSPIRNDTGEIIGASSIARDITRQKRAEAEREALIKSLTTTSRQVRALTGRIPLCPTCRRIRDGKGYWHQLEAYLVQHSDLTFTNKLCPDCGGQGEPSFELRKNERKDK